jgi:hypothetical protein
MTEIEQHRALDCLTCDEPPLLPPVTDPGDAEKKTPPRIRGGVSAS